MSVIDFILSNILPVFLIGIALFFFYNIYRFRKRIQQNQTTKEKGVSRIGYSFNVDKESNGNPSGLQAEKSKKENKVIFEGTTGGIAWKLTSVNLITAPGTNQVWKSKSAWKTTDVKWPEGCFLIIISTYGEINSGDFVLPGFLNRIIKYTEEQMLDIYTSEYFGPDYKELVGFKNDSIALKIDLLSDFFILTNKPGIAEKFLDDSTVNAISAWKKKDLGFQNESNVDRFGVLFAPDAMFVSCQQALRKSEEVKIFSDFAAAMAVKMKMKID
jgi:hypothetical protein